MAQQKPSSINLGISPIPEIDESKYPSIYNEIFRIKNALTNLALALDSYTGALSEDPTIWSYAATIPAEYIRLQNITRLYVICDEAMTQGQTANLRNVAGTLTARLSDATTNAEPCRAYLLTSSIAIGEYGEFILAGLNPNYAGLTPGTTYYQSAATPGAITATAPVAVGNIEQVVGWAINATTLWFIPNTTWIQH